MAEGPYLMGIDFGTGGARVGIFDREGTPLVFHATEWETRFPRPGWAEQAPADWGAGGAGVGIFGREGTPLVFHATEWETRFPRSGWAEQAPDDWWSCLVVA